MFRRPRICSIVLWYVLAICDKSGMSRLRSGAPSSGPLPSKPWLVTASVPIPRRRKSSLARGWRCSGGLASAPLCSGMCWRSVTSRACRGFAQEHRPLVLSRPHHGFPLGAHPPPPQIESGARMAMLRRPRICFIVLWYVLAMCDKSGMSRLRSGAPSSGPLPSKSWLSTRRPSPAAANRVWREDGDAPAASHLLHCVGDV